MLVSHRHWMYAALIDSRDLIVAKSALVKETDPLFIPVRDVLETNQHTVVCEDVFEDSDWMFGKAEITVYKLGEV